jgi:carbonic anhydrase
MFVRENFRKWGRVAVLGSLVFGLAAVVYAQVAAQTKATQAAATPDAVIAALKAGNERFVSGNMVNRDLHAQIKQTAKGQYPLAAIVGCIDSRVPPEMVFDMGIGDMFVARVAGNYVETDILGSLEFATKVAGSKVIVVMGHSHCGAVKGACDNVELGNLTHTLSNIMPAVYATKNVAGERSSKNTAFVSAVAERNVRMNVDNLIERSTVIRELVDAGKLKVIGAMYDIETGRVTFYE